MKEDWCDENLATLLEKYEGLTPEEQAFYIIYFDHMNLNSEDIKVNRLTPYKIRIESHNFCPYLEACRMLELDTREVCQETGEQLFQALASRVHPRLKFSRNYDNIRPNNTFCEEFIELIY